MRTEPTSTDFEVFLRRTFTVEARRPSCVFAESFASWSADLLCALFLWPFTHLTSTRFPVRLAIFRSSFHMGAFATGLPSRVIQPACGQLNRALLYPSTRYIE